MNEFPFLVTLFEPGLAAWFEQAFIVLSRLSPFKMLAFLIPPLVVALIAVALQVHLGRKTTWRRIWEELRAAHHLSPSFRVELWLLALSLLSLTGMVCGLAMQWHLAFEQGIEQLFFHVWPEEWTIAGIGQRFTRQPLLGFCFYVVLFDFILYVTHRLKHSRALWDIHKVHHSTTTFNLIFAIFSRDRSIVPSFILVDWIPFAILLPLGMPAVEVTIYYVIYRRLDKVRNVWIHMPFYTSFGWLDYVFVSPAVHWVHHSSQLEHRDKNFGTLFSVWDVMFGTFCPPPSQAPALGIGEDGERLHRSVLAFYWLPIYDLARTWAGFFSRLAPPRLRTAAATGLKLSLRRQHL